MMVKPKWLKHINNYVFTLGGLKLDFTNVKKYFGCFIAADLYDDHDMRRQTRCVYARGKLLIKQFRHCSDDVKVQFFK